MTEISKYIEHTLLKQDATHTDFIKLFDEAKKYNFLGVCVNPLYVSLAKENLKDSDVKIVTVVGFPLGASRSDVKAFETQKAIEDGADEVDMVLNVTKMKDKDYDFVQKDIETVKKSCKDKPLKVILETDLLTNEEIVKACELCVKAKADFVKTSSGFGSGGATVQDVKLMKSVVGDKCQVKASTGINNREICDAMIEAGAVRMGTSKGIYIVNDMEPNI